MLYNSTSVPSLCILPESVFANTRSLHCVTGQACPSTYVGLSLPDSQCPGNQRLCIIFLGGRKPQGEIR